MSNAVFRPSRFISYTVKVTRQCGAWALISRALARPYSNFGRFGTRVLVFAAKNLWRGMPVVRPGDQAGVVI
ncbi:hypothetical protein ACFQL8_09175 [Streptomyces goshikiensis]|uniref:hypothetical protein n=1 Tax=Streptomyces goshikiensis TaxID=1942 RepID=UPI0033328396